MTAFLGAVFAIFTRLWSLVSGLWRLASELINIRGSRTDRSQSDGKVAQRSKVQWFVAILVFAFALWFGPSNRLLRALVPSAGFVVKVLCTIISLFVVLVIGGRRLASHPQIRPDYQLLKALQTFERERPEGLDFWKVQAPIDGRVDGAVLLTGSTGFVGGGILFALLARAEELGVSRIVLVVRKRSGSTAKARVEELGKHPMYAPVRDTFQRLVVAMEGDTAQKNFGWGDSLGTWPYSEPLSAIIHCAGDVRFDQPLTQAATGLISGTLQVAELSSAFKARRFVFVSTAFVHPEPPTEGALPEGLADLKGFNVMELYRDAMSDARWASKVMVDLGYPNTYTFAKAMAEHLVTQFCEANNVDVRIVRPSIVGPAWASPYPGWMGDKPSTVVAAGVLLVKRGLRVFRTSGHACPCVPVDLVAAKTLEAMSDMKHGSIFAAAVDASESSSILSFESFILSLFQMLALRGNMSLPEVGLLVRCQQWSRSARGFRLTHYWTTTVLHQVALRVCNIVYTVADLWGGKTRALWQDRVALINLLLRYDSLPEQYEPFSCASRPWLFQSSLRLPKDFDAYEYAVLVHRSSIHFGDNQKAYNGTKEAKAAFRSLEMLPRRSLISDALLSFSTPKTPLIQCCALLLIKRVAGWMDLKVKVDASTLNPLSSVSAPIVLLPNHRSLLDACIVGLTCVTMRPMVPLLQLPHVAADTEFESLPFMGHIISSLGAFYVRRGGGGVQRDPSLRGKISDVFSNGRPIEMFLEGFRSRGRRQMRLRTGMLLTLQEAVDQNVTLVPMALSYELLPEDNTFFREMSGLPRTSLSTPGFFDWIRRGVQGELPSFGDVHIAMGTPRLLEKARDIRETLTKVQEELVTLPNITDIHVHALAQILELSEVAVVGAFKRAGSPVVPSRLIDSSGSVTLEEAQRWPLALQSVMHMHHRLPRDWANWLVEPVQEVMETTGSDSSNTDGSMQVVDPVDVQGESTIVANGVAHSSADGEVAFNLDVVFSNLCVIFDAAEKAAQDAANEIVKEGMSSVSEEHLAQYLIQMRAGPPAVLARGAAYIIARRLKSSVKTTVPISPTSRATKASAPGISSVLPIWPRIGANKFRNSDKESVDRWGFADTRFIAEWSDGAQVLRMNSKRYPAIGDRPLRALYAYFEKEIGVKLNIREKLPDADLPTLPPPAKSLLKRLEEHVPKGRINVTAEARCRAGTGHSLSDIWKLRTQWETVRFPDAVVRPETEEEVLAILKGATGKNGYAVIPVGGRTNVTSATQVPSKEVDARPYVSLDMKGLAKVLWVNKQDGVAHIQCGITGTALKDELAKKGVNMGMEPDSMELSTLGGWIATRASGMKRARYGNIEEMLVEARVATPNGLLWQHNGGTGAAQRQTAFGRCSNNASLPCLILGSEGCLGIVVSAIVRVKPLPEVTEYESILFHDWEKGCAFMRDVGKLPERVRPTSCRLMDNLQFGMSRAIKDGQPQPPVKLAVTKAVLAVKGYDINKACACTLLFEGSRAEVDLQKKLLVPLVKKAGAMWGGSESGESGYAMTFAIAYLRDVVMDYKVLAESLETQVPWSCFDKVWGPVCERVRAEHKAMKLPGKVWMCVRVTQIYDEGAVLYMYMAISTDGLSAARALESFEHLEHIARTVILEQGGCLSHHHGNGKHRAKMLSSVQAPEMTMLMRGIKQASDPENILAARNGPWSGEAMQLRRPEERAEGETGY